PDAGALTAVVAGAAQADEGAQSLLAWLAMQSGARRASWSWWTRQRADISATWGDWSGQGDPHLRRCEAAMDEALDQGVTLSAGGSSEAPEADTPWVTLAHRQLATSGGGVAACIPLPGAANPLGAVCLEWPPGTSPSPALMQALEQAVVQVSPV